MKHWQVKLRQQDDQILTSAEGPLRLSKGKFMGCNDRYSSMKKQNGRRFFYYKNTFRQIMLSDNKILVKNYSLNSPKDQMLYRCAQRARMRLTTEADDARQPWLASHLGFGQPNSIVAHVQLRSVLGFAVACDLCDVALYRRAVR
jgi:hypothetical protein